MQKKGGECVKQLVINFFRDEEGLETIEMVIVLVVIVGIAFAFRKTLVSWFNGFLEDTAKQNSEIGEIKTKDAFSTK